MKSEKIDFWDMGKDYIMAVAGSERGSVRSYSMLQGDVSILAPEISDINEFTTSLKSEFYNIKKRAKQFKSEWKKTPTWKKIVGSTSVPGKVSRNL